MIDRVASEMSAFTWEFLGHPHLKGKASWTCHMKYLSRVSGVQQERGGLNIIYDIYLTYIWHIFYIYFTYILHIFYIYFTFVNLWIWHICPGSAECSKNVEDCSEGGATGRGYGGTMTFQANGMVGIDMCLIRSCRRKYSRINVWENIL